MLQKINFQTHSVTDRTRTRAHGSIANTAIPIAKYHTTCKQRVLPFLLRLPKTTTWSTHRLIHTSTQYDGNGRGRHEISRPSLAHIHSFPRHAHATLGPGSYSTFGQVSSLTSVLVQLLPGLSMSTCWRFRRIVPGNAPATCRCSKTLASHFPFHLPSSRDIPRLCQTAAPVFVPAGREESGPVQWRGGWDIGLSRRRLTSPNQPLASPQAPKTTASP
ncbi:hypothetical protein LXA43DRAFT_406903 [Ganoderma leucocontextum]|nr:hypothetical protein LXA43DRAFT_406903 [Ganoderma leucocontextum]